METSSIIGSFFEINGIVDYYQEWPLSDYELEEYALKKYGSIENAEQVRHYVTVETKDSDGNIVLPGGLIVNEEYRFYYFASPDSNVELSVEPNLRYVSRPRKEPERS